VHDPVLGTLSFDPEQCAWRTSVEVQSGRIGFVVGGTTEPDARLLAHAADIARSGDAFLQSMREYLSAEAERDERWRHQVRARPDDGMLYFSGPDRQERVWRCDYVKRKPQQLGFDS
jgi:hypothetical protein